MADATATPATVQVLAYALDYGGSDFGGIVEGDVDYSFPVTLAVDAVAVTADVPTHHAHVPFDTWRPRFSPDRQVMLVCRTTPGDHDTDLTSMQLWVFPADGGEPERVKGPPSESGYVTYGHPEWAPDSSAVVVFAETITQWQILVLDSTDYDTVLRTAYAVTKPDLATDASYGPDGTIYFVEASGASYYIASITDGATPVHTRLLSSSNVLADPMISPDGSQLVYAERLSAPDMSHEFGVWRLRRFILSDSSFTTVINDGNANQHPTWMTDRTLLFQTYRYGTDTEQQIARIRTDGSSHIVLGEGEYPSPQKV